MSRAFNWTSEDIDEMDIELFYDYLIVNSIDREEQKKPKKKYIDEIM